MVKLLYCSFLRLIYSCITILTVFFIYDYVFNQKNLVTIESCYDGDTCTTKKGEKIRLACIDAPELRGSNSDLIQAKSARDYLNSLVANSTVTIRRITEDRYGRTIAELSKGPVNIQEQLVKNGYARIYKKYAHHCKWSDNQR